MLKTVLHGAVAVLAVGALAIGCSEHDRITGGPSPDFKDVYPGPTVEQASWVGDDQRALSHNGVDVANPEFFPCFDSDVGILTYTTDGGTRLFASYWNGFIFSSPVEILAENYDPAGVVGNIQVCWLNPTASGTTNRRGDAIMLFARDELDDPRTPVASALENNFRLYSSYFTSQLASTGQVGAIKFGFDTRADYVYTAPPVIAGPPALRESVVGDYGIVSDSNYLSHSGGDVQVSGQKTTYVYALWFSGNGATPSDVRAYSAPFDLSQANTSNTFNGLPAQHAGQAGAGEDVIAAFTAHDGTVFFNSVDDGGTGHVLLDHSNFGAPTIASTIASRDEALGTGAAPITAQLPLPAHVYGPDHGLRDVVAVTLESGFGNTGTTSGEDTDVMLHVIDPTLAATANPGVEIDAFSGTTTLGTESADAGFLDTRIALGAEWIAVGFTQNNSLDTAAPGLLNNPKGVVVQTALAGDDARSEALSASAAIQLSQLSGAPGVGDVGTWAFQQGLADGTGHPKCNVQSDHLAMSIIFDQTQDNATAAAVRQLRLNTLHAVLDPALTPTAPPTTGPTSAIASVVDSIHETWITGGGGFSNLWGTGLATAFDDGSGSAAVVYFHQAFQPDATRVAATLTYVSTRAYFWRGGITTLISSLPPLNTPEGKQVNGPLLPPTIVQTGTQTRPDSNGNFAGTGVHMFWSQTLQSAGSRSTVASVFWDKEAANRSSPPTLLDQFLPPRTTTGTNDPFIIDNDLSDDSIPGQGFRAGGGGDAAHYYFSQGGNVWWNEFIGDTWLELSGLSEPQLVTHDSSAGVAAAIIVERGSFDCRDEPAVMTIWTRLDDDGTGDLRLHARPNN